MFDKEKSAAGEDKLRAQSDAMGRVARHNAGKRARAHVMTFGCQQNAADSEYICGMLDKMGYALADTPEGADVVVINTCAVREHAELRALGNIGALVHGKRANPAQIIALCGCMAAREGVAQLIKNSYPYVDILFGPAALWRLPELLGNALCGGKKIFCTGASETEIVEGMPVKRGGGVKAGVPVMYGCNNFCSYCVVPYVRGRERSRAGDAVLRDVEKLVSEGVKDITLLGQNVNSYGRDIPGGADFSDLLRRAASIEGDFLIRFMTSHPKDASKRLFDAMAESEKVARHLHLPFQSGSDRVLREMNRNYTARGYLELIAYARSVMPGLVVTSDVIVGFPGETEDEFEQTVGLVREAGFDALFTFIYSKRPGTPAEKLEDPFTREEKQARFDRLLQVQNAISADKHAAYVGSVQRVLVHERDGEAGLLSARTNGGRPVRFEGDDSAVGSFTDVIITGNSSWALFGRARRRAASREGEDE